MGLKLVKEVEDERGKIIFCINNDSFIRIVEIKKGYARGGHYHKYDQPHFIISGIIEYREEDVNNRKEIIKIIDKPTIINISSYKAHLFIALEDTIFIETSKNEYESFVYKKYRDIVEDKLIHTDT